MIFLITSAENCKKSCYKMFIILNVIQFTVFAKKKKKQKQTKNMKITESDHWPFLLPLPLSLSLSLSPPLYLSFLFMYPVYKAYACNKTKHRKESDVGNRKYLISMIYTISSVETSSNKRKSKRRSRAKLVAKETTGLPFE